eukprot:scaffold4273_cov106-Isochrysis_galbana.AAC.5
MIHSAGLALPTDFPISPAAFFCLGPARPAPPRPSLARTSSRLVILSAHSARRCGLVPARLSSFHRCSQLIFELEPT